MKTLSRCGKTALLLQWLLKYFELNKNSIICIYCHGIEFYAKSYKEAQDFILKNKLPNNDKVKL